MTRRAEFESLLGDIISTPVEFAGVRSTAKSTTKRSRRLRGNVTELDDGISEQAVLHELRRAKERLRRYPSLFSGDPDGYFTYDDPILAVAAYVYQSHLLMSSALGLAGDDGENLRNETFWQWARTGIHMWLSRNDKAFQTLMGMTPDEAIPVEKETIRIAVVGDAGFRGFAQRSVIESIEARHREMPFDFVIHLGDIYFAGSRAEMLKNFLAPFRKAGPRVLTLVGNHDLYFGGEPFLDALDDLQQPSRYFAVENAHWRIACLDTALPAQTLRRSAGLLDKGQLAWLDKRLALKDGRKTVLMSHHFAVSGWKASSQGLQRQLSRHFATIFSWYWGHEHACAVYDRRTAGFDGACVGNGAFLELWTMPTHTPLPEWYARGRCSCYEPTSKFWPHGYLELELRPDSVSESYHLEGGESYNRVLLR